MIDVEAELQVPLDRGATINDNIVYFIGGYIAKTTKKKRLSCKFCAPTLGDFENAISDIISASEFTRNKNVGKLTFCTSNLYRLLSIVENAFLKCYKSGLLFERNAFHDIVEVVADGSKLPPVGCAIHCVALMTNIIYDYLLLRFKAVAKAKTEIWLEEKRSASHSKMKLSKMVVGPQKKIQNSLPINDVHSSALLPPVPVNLPVSDISNTSQKSTNKRKRVTCGKENKQPNKRQKNNPEANLVIPVVPVVHVVSAVPTLHVEPVLRTNKRKTINPVIIPVVPALHVQPVVRTYTRKTIRM